MLLTFWYYLSNTSPRATDISFVIREGILPDCYQTAADWSRAEGGLGGSVVVMSSWVRLHSWRLMPGAFKAGKIRIAEGERFNRQPSTQPGGWA